VLNGPSSAGQTTLARAVRDARGGTLALSLDDLFCVAGPRTKSDWKLFRALSKATFEAAAALAKSGFDVVVDTVFERIDCLTMTRESLSEPMLVAVTCPVEILEQRERARGDRRVGQARDQHGRVLHDAVYEMTLDTNELSLGECVARVCALFER